MPSYIVKLGDKYLEWSTISDQPTCYGGDLEGFKEWYLERENKKAGTDLDERLARVEKHGTSMDYGPPQERADFLDFLIRTNRCGPNEETLTKEQLIEKFCSGVPS